MVVFNNYGFAGSSKVDVAGNLKFRPVKHFYYFKNWWYFDKSSNQRAKACLNSIGMQKKGIIP